MKKFYATNAKAATEQINVRADSSAAVLALGCTEIDMELIK